MGSAFGNPQEEEEESQKELNNMVEKIEQTQKQMAEAVESATSEEEVLLPAINGFTSMIAPTKWMLHKLVQKRCIGLPQERIDACKNISADYKKVLFDTMEFTPSLQKLFRSQMTGAETLMELRLQDPEQNPTFAYLLGSARQKFANGEQAAKKSKAQAAELASKWVGIKMAIEDEIKELGTYAEHCLWEKKKMYALAGVAGVATLVCVGLVVHFGAAAAAAAAQASAYASKAAAAQNAAAQAANASYFSYQHFQAVAYAQIAAQQTHMAAQASAAFSTALYGAVASGAVATAAGAGAYYSAMQAQECHEHGANLGNQLERIKTLNDKYNALMQCAEESDKLLHIIISFLAAIELESEDLKMKCEAGLAQVLGLLRSELAGEQLEKYIKTLNNMMDATDALSQKCIEGLDAWVGSRTESSCQRHTTSRRAYPMLAHPVHIEQLPNAQEDHDVDSLVTDESLTVTATPTPSEFAFVQELVANSA